MYFNSIIESLWLKTKGLGMQSSEGVTGVLRFDPRGMTHISWLRSQSVFPTPVYIPVECTKNIATSFPLRRNRRRGTLSALMEIWPYILSFPEHPIDCTGQPHSILKENTVFLNLSTIDIALYAIFFFLQEVVKSIVRHLHKSQLKTLM